MKKLLVLTSLLLLLFSGCTPKIVYKKELVCVEQKTVTKPSAGIRIHPNDVNVAKAYKEANDMAYEFYEGQVNRNNVLCEEAATKNKKNKAKK